MEDTSSKFPLLFRYLLTLSYDNTHDDSTRYTVCLFTLLSNGNIFILFVTNSIVYTTRPFIFLSLFSQCCHIATIRMCNVTNIMLHSVYQSKINFGKLKLFKFFCNCTRMKLYVCKSVNYQDFFFVFSLRSKTK